MKAISLDPDTAIGEIMRRWPSTIRVVIRYRMLCVGCPIAFFHTIADACAAHAVDEESFCADLLAAIRSDSTRGAAVPFETTFRTSTAEAGV